MREISITNRFKKYLKKAKKNSRQNTNKLLVAIEILETHGILSEDYLPHCLSGNWKPKWECHIQPNFLLIYEVTEDVLRLERCGSHSELFEWILVGSELGRLRASIRANEVRLDWRKSVKGSHKNDHTHIL